MHADDRPIQPRRQLVPRARVRLRVPDAVPDESMFFLVAMVAGAVCGWVVALG